MDLNGINAVRVKDKNVSLKQLLVKARLGDGISAVEECAEDLALQCWAEELGIRPSAAVLQEAVTEFRRANRLFTAAQTNEWLHYRGASLEALIEYLSPKAARNLIMESIVSEEEVRRHFQEHILEYEQAEISRIVTAEFGQAQELRFRMEEGVDFHTLARQYSIDAETRKAGGYIGLISPRSKDCRWSLTYAGS